MLLAGSLKGLFNSVLSRFILYTAAGYLLKCRSDYVILSSVKFLHGSSVALKKALYLSPLLPPILCQSQMNFTQFSMVLCSVLPPRHHTCYRLAFEVFFPSALSLAELPHSLCSSLDIFLWKVLIRCFSLHKYTYHVFP